MDKYDQHGQKFDKLDKTEHLTAWAMGMNLTKIQNE